ncbi:peptidoglycan recognition protein family protein [Pseudorhodobacter aquimaris]|uniref:peptidoglycan recognition protein family protein n=1 Tax=Pseudorhodobacter aquimaris TaxID=687412 RepID=UPI00067AF630|nr:peptidoglycan recognition family protein [Pseudorhodobacter aquimaris]
MKRIILHWTAGTHHVSALDRAHYHFIVAGDGSVIEGDLRPESNRVINSGRYAAHTRGLNTGSIGVAMAAMLGARERPFDAGAFPITPVQLATFTDLVAELALTYKIRVTRKTVLTHAEVEPTLNVWQRGKWDVAWLPGMKATGDPVTVGDRLRWLIEENIGQINRESIAL